MIKEQFEKLVRAQADKDAKTQGNISKVKNRLFQTEYVIPK
jgi:hypothetical protein